MQRSRSTRAPILVALAASACLSSAPARADAVADFYKDKTITLVSAGEAGGAHGDLCAAPGPAFQAAHPRQSQRRDPVHGGRRRQSRAQLPAQRRAEGRHRHRPSAAGPDLQRAHRHRGGQIRRRQGALSRRRRRDPHHRQRLERERHPHARGRKAARGADGREREIRPDLHHPGHAQCRAGHQVQAGGRLRRHQPHQPRDGARRGPRPGRLLADDHRDQARVGRART